jgi:hypothetical protein
MLLSAVSVLVVAQSSLKIPEGLMNNSVFYVVVIRPHNMMSTAKIIRRAGHVNRPEILGLEKMHGRLLEN